MEMTIFEFVEIAREYSNLGNAIQNQLDAVIEDGVRTDPNAINWNALHYYIMPFLQRAGEFGIELLDLDEHVRILLEGEEE